VSRYAIAIVLLFLAASVACSQVRIEKIDATVAEGKLVSISPKTVTFSVGTAKQTVACRDISEIVLAKGAKLMDRAGQHVLVTSAGDYFAAKGILTVDGQFRFVNPMVGSVSVPFSAARMVYLPGATQKPSTIRKKISQFKLTSTTSDILIVEKKADALVTIEGVLKAIDATGVVFRWNEADGRAERKVVRAIRLAIVGKAPSVVGTVVGVDGTRLGFSSMSYSGGKFTITSPTIGKRVVQVKAVAAVRFNSDRVVNLSDIKPAAVKEHGFLDTVFSYRRDLAVSGKPLRLDGRTYKMGLGVHSFCELTYELGGKYTAFVAVVGIDDAVRPRGDVKLHLLGDGKALIKPVHLTGKGTSQIVRAKLTGLKRLTIRVDFGTDKLDVGDHVDIAAARLIK